MIKCILIILIIFIGQITLRGQSKIDSLKAVVSSIDSDSLKIRTFLRLFYEYHRTDLNIALAYTRNAEELARKTGLQNLMAEAIHRKGTVLFNMGQMEKAEEAYADALSILTSLDDKEYIPMVNIDRARLLQSRSKYEDAIKVYIETLPLAKDLGDKNLEARIHNSIGGLFKEQKQYQKAIEHYGLALGLVEELNFKPGISACLTNLGTIHIRLKSYDKALVYLNKSLTLKKESNDPLGASRVLNNVADIYNNKEQYQVADTYYQEAYELAKQVDNAQQVALVEYGMAEVSFNKGDFANCVRLAGNIVNTPIYKNDLDLAIKINELLSKAYKKAGQFQLALNHSEIYNVLSDSLYNDKIIEVTSELEAKYQNEQKAKEIALLQSEKELQQLQIDKRKEERIYLIGFIGISFLLMGLGYNQYRIKQKANAKLKELDQLKSDFFANISHEFRTPLSLLMAPLKGKIEGAKNSKEEEEYQMMYRNADRLFQLINQLLDLSKLENGKMRLQKSSVEVNSYFRVIAAPFSSLAEYKKITFSCSIPKDKIWLEFDRDIIEKSCNNLLSNAFKFTPEGGKVSLEICCSDVKLVIKVSDTGFGISREDQSRIFNRFFQSPGSKQLGTGIGLALTKELVELHHGHIKLESQPDKGTSLTIDIPTKRSKEEHVTALVFSPKENFKTTQRDELEAEPVVRDGPVILIIEDNPDLQGYLSELMSSRYVIHTCDNGQKGIDKAKEIIPDLVISDIMMPVKNGIEVCNELKKAIETNHIPVILLTARADQESKLQGLSIGADDYLLKPFDPKELKIRVSNLLKQRRSLKEKYTRLLLLQPDEIEVSTAEESFLKTVMEIVSRHMDNTDFTTEQFCLESGMSRMQLHRKLTALTGHSSMAFVRHQRLHRATQLLKAGEAVSQVAYAIGFTGLSSFTRAFKKEYGVAPSEYVTSDVSRM